jgi:hypothetical protein
VSSSDQKKAHIRGYLLILMQEGVFSGARGGLAVMAAAVRAFGRDVGVVVGEMADEFGRTGGNRIVSDLMGVGARAMANISDRGLKQAWADLFRRK